MDKAEFVARFGGIFEHSAWIAERAWENSDLPATPDADSLHSCLAAAFRAANEDARLGVLRAHPDLAGKLAVAGELTEHSRQEQAGAGLEQLTETEFARFTDLNTRYQTKFDFLSSSPSRA